ncbi:MAG: hypothetical protein ACI9W4_001013 [Rhodothermales bacterium]|jgi:hypothetical protein
MAQDRIYSEEEIGRVLKRAAEIQGKQPRSSSYGLSLDELKELASDSGIDPELVIAAVSELKADQEAQEKTFWGGPLSSTLIRSVDGRLSDDTWEEMVAILRRAYKETGETERRGTTRQWMSKGQDGGRGHLIATYRDGRTELELFYGNPTIAIPFYIIPLVLSIIALPIIFEPMGLSGWPAFFVWFTFVASMLGAARFGVSTSASGMHNKTKNMVDDLAALAKKRAPEAAAPQQPAPEVKATQAAGPYLQVPSDDFKSESDASQKDPQRLR